jgi:hypothetical protein
MSHGKYFINELDQQSFCLEAALHRFQKLMEGHYRFKPVLKQFVVILGRSVSVCVLSLLLKVDLNLTLKGLIWSQISKVYLGSMCRAVLIG